MTLYVGTSGWAYPGWKGAFYPSDLPQKRFLEHYATRLNSCEINATYHRQQSPETYEKWKTSVPNGFRFSTKAHRAISPRMLDTPVLGEFLAQTRALEDRLGAVLFQFPLKRDGNEQAMDGFLRRVGDGVPFALELKHPSWGEEGFADRVGDAGGTLCYVDRTGDAPDALPAGPIAYIRLRSPSYTDAQRTRWASRLDEEARRRDVYCFVKHDDAPAGDEHAGVGLAEWMLTRNL